MTKIPLKNEQKLQIELDLVQKRSRSRILSIETIKKEVADAEEHLTFILPKKCWKGLVLELQPDAQSFASAYRGSPESTKITLTRTTSGWTVTSVFRTYCDHRTTRKIIGLDERKDEIATKLSKF